MPLPENQTLSKLYYSIGEVAQMLKVNTSLLRFWEKEFNLVVSKKNKKGNRLFSVKEIEQIKRIYQFVKVEGYTLEGAKKALKQKGIATIHTTNSASPVAQIVDANQNKDFSVIIEKLEGIKFKLLNLPVQAFQQQKNDSFLDQTDTTNASAAIEVSPSENQQSPSHPSPTPSKPKSVSKPKPNTNTPTLFDF